MGQRSQIYVRYNLCGGKDKKGLIARYFQWNFAERMISRASYTMLHLKNLLSTSGCLGEESVAKIIRVIDTNFDMKDITISDDILKNKRKFYDECRNKIFFEQDNNDGQLFIDVTNGEIKYCFMKYYNEGKPMTAKEYMEWQRGIKWEEPSKWFTREMIECARGNIETIDAIATKMTKEELKIFLNDDYSHLLGSDEDF